MAEKSEVIEGLDDILHEMFGPERAEAVKPDVAPWHAGIGAKSIDRIDFIFYVEKKWGVSDFGERFDSFSLNEIAAFISACTPGSDAH